ncbi:hypothetical protein ACQ4PT_016124 [Festuca glaucescens]
MATVCAVILLPLLITLQHLAAADVFCDNLKVVAAMLPKNTSSSPLCFTTATIGQAPDVVYALALCRGDVVNDTDCADCIASGFNILQNLTPPRQQCSYPDAYYGVCHLAYSTDNILRLPYNVTGDDMLEFELWNVMNFTSDARLMAGLVKELMVETVEMAASATPRRFATGLMYGGSTFPIVRSMAQCTPDLSAGDCLACLRHLLAKVNSTMALRIGGQIHVIHCYFRYETYAFYNGPPMLRLGQAPAPAPSLDSTPSKNKSKSASALVHASMFLMGYGTARRWHNLRLGELSVPGFLILFLSFILLMPLPATATGGVCGNGGNYTANSNYQSNLAALAATLPTNASASSELFAQATVGEAPDAVHALTLCRGDIVNTTACKGCIADSFQDAQQACPYYSNDGARLSCLLGFSGDDGFLGPAASGITDTSTLFQSWNQEIIIGDAGVVADGVHAVLNGTASYAATTQRRFATVVMDSINSTIPALYSLAQCTPDLSAGDCLACLQHLVGMVNATTSVLKGGRILVLRCNIRFELFQFYNGQPLQRMSPLSIAPASPVRAPSTGKRHGIKPLKNSISVVVPVALVASCFIFYRNRHITKVTIKLQPTRRIHNLQSGDELVGEMGAGFSDFLVFDFHQILEATSNFSEQNKLGEGGFGPVYKGQFPGGMEIAVKRLASHSGQGLIEFKNEVEVIAKLQHRNLVRLMGCCTQKDEKILVYEYLPNKSLDFFIFDENRKYLLDWNKRLAIIEGIAEGLLYLHKHSRLRVIHRDLKPGNILLDSEMNPKISDFGLAKIFNSNNNEGNTTRRVVGTYGYMAPEYAYQGLCSLKSDVFSFGVLTLEIVSGKRNSGGNQYGDFINLLGYAWKLFEEGRWIELVDTSLLPSCHCTQMMRCINVALLCSQEKASDRPTMPGVVAMLGSRTMILREPKHPAYFNLSVQDEEEAAATRSCSVNNVTISIITAR